METTDYIYFRPIWTCGRYDASKHVAIMYNLIAGFSYFFEGDSADIINYVLTVKRNSRVDIEYISANTDTNLESLIGFFRELSNEGLLVPNDLSDKDVAQYRRQLAYFKTQARSIQKSTVDKLPMDTTNAEQQYSMCIDDGCTVASVMFELTYNCSEKCIHCYNPGATRNDKEVCHRADRKELTIDEYKNLIDQLYNLGLFKVCLSGGDPFSKPIVWEIIEYLYQKDIAFDIFTNGQRIVEHCEKLANYYPRTVGISIYSGNAEDHDRITRVKGSWERSMKVVKSLSELAVPMNLKCCIMQPNVRSYYLVADIAQRYGCEVQYEINISESVEGDTCAKQLRLNEEQLAVILRDDNIRLYVGPEAPNFGGQTKLLSENGCGAGDTGFCVTPDGKFRPCCAFPLDLGDFKETSIADIIHKSAELAKWRTATLQSYEECGRYDYCAYCNLCPGVNFIEHGDYKKAAETNCYMAKTRYKLAQTFKLNYSQWSKEELHKRISKLESVEIRLMRTTKG